MNTAVTRILRVFRPSLLLCALQTQAHRKDGPLSRRKIRMFHAIPGLRVTEALRKIEITLCRILEKRSLPSASSSVP